MADSAEFSWMKAWLGATMAGLVVALIFFVHGAIRIPTLLVGMILLLLMAGWALWAWRRGDRDLATGVAVGYALLTLISGGQCTLFVEEDIDAALGPLTGFFIYPLFLVAALITIGVVSAASRLRARKESQQ